MKSLITVPFLLLLTIPGLASTSNPSAFITEAMKGDNSEIKLGQLAEAKGQNAKVKDFGKTLVADHTRAKQEAANVASAMSVTPTDEASPAALAEYTKLSGEPRSSFDRDFARYMVSDHERVIKMFEAQAESKDKTASLAQQQLPTLRKHLAIARSLENS